MNYPDQDYPDKAPALAGLYEATRNLSVSDAAQVIRISKGYGIPTADAAAALPTFGSYANDDVDWDGVRVRAPLTTEFLMNDPYYAKALQSSIRDMEAAEGTVKTWKALQNGFKGVGRGLLRFGQMVQETVQNADNTLAPVNEADVWANPAKESVKAFENQNKTFVSATTLRNMAESSWLKPKSNTPDGLAEELWLGFMETVPQVAAQLLVAGATGGTSGLVAGTLFMGSQIAGSQYEKLTEQKVEPFRAFQASIADAVMQAPLEMLSLGKTFKRIPVGKAAREYLEKATTEAITEWAQQYPEAATEIWATRPGVSVQQVAAEIVNDIANFGPISQEGLKQGVIAAPFGLLGGWAANNAAKLKERRAEAGKAYAESLQEKAAKMSGASPEAAAAYINHVTGDDVVYAQPDALFQIALDKPEIIEALGVTIDEVEQARADGQLVEIPIGEYSVVMSANPDAAKILNEHITTDVSEETLTEARERASVSRNQKDVSDAATEARQSQVELKSAQKELYDEAVSAGMKPDEAGNLVAMFTANSRIYAAAKGQSHAQWFRENRPVIRKGREMVAGALGQSDWTQKDIPLPNTVSVIKIEKPANTTQLTGNTVKNLYSKVRRQFQGKTFINSHTGWEIGVSKTGLGKVISHAASPEIQLTLSELDKMIERSVYLKTARDGENRPDIKAWHYFYAPVDIGEKNYTMKIVVRETIQGQKFYDHAIIETERPAGKVLLGGTPEGELRHQAVSESSNISIDDLIQNVNQARQVDQLFQSPLGFYSAVARAIKSMDFKTMPAKDLLSRIVKTPGVKQEELGELGLIDWLKGQDGKVTKDQVLAFVEQGGVEIEEVVKGAGGGFRLDYEQDPEDGFWRVFTVDNEEIVEAFDNRAEAREFADRENLKRGNAKFGQYQLPGGENYREVLLTLPTKSTKAIQAEEIVDAVGRGWEEGEAAQEKYGMTYKEALEIAEQANGIHATFRSSHWEEQNVLAHFRLNDRIVDGKKVLFIEEVQSDWHQRGKKEGYLSTIDTSGWKATELPGWAVYAKDIDKNPLDELAKRFETKEEADRYAKSLYKIESVFETKTHEDSGRYDVVNKNGELIGQVVAKDEAQAINRVKISQEIGNVPDAPFKSTPAWSMLAFKRILRLAAEQGYDSVAWTPGEVQAERYDLSKQISSLAWSPYDNGTGLLYAEDHSKNKVISKVIKETELEENVGKDVAKKLIDQPAEDGMKMLQGLDLKVGGEGMKGFYDRILPAEVGKYLKKLDKDARVGTTTIGKQTYSNVEPNIYGDYEDTTNATDTGTDSVEVWSVPVTDKIRESVMQGQALYQSAKGSIHWEDGKAVISLFKTADASTGIHELLGHYMTQNLLDWGSQDDAPDWMKQDRKTMLEWAGIEDWDGATKEQKVEAHEKWARAAEAYVMEGKAPSLELRDVFRRFADWMRQVYRAMRDMGVEIGPGMRGVFDRMLASEEEIAHASTVSEFMNENADLYVGLTDRQKESLAKQHDQIMERGKEVLLKELIGDINAERKQAMAAERERIEAEVRHEVSNQPFYRMVRELRKPAIRNPVNELTKEWQKKVDDMARYLRDHHGDGVENVKVYDGDIRDEQAKPEAYFRVSHNVKWYQDLYAELGKTPTLGDYKMLAEDFLRRGFEDLSGYVDPDVDFLEIEQQLEELQKTPQAIPMVLKINTAWLKENYPEELNTFAFMHSSLGQYDLEDLASFYRFSSADEIIWRMKNTPPLSKEIKDAVDARMNKAFPVLTNAEIAEKAEAAMHNEESVALLAVQLDLIREKAGQMRTAEESRKQALQDRELARVSAQKAMEKMPLERAMNLPVWIAAARRAAVKADKAIAEGNWVAAFEQKNIQLHNNAMIQESLNARREFDRVSRYLKRQQGSGKETWITDEAGPDGMVAKSDRHFAAAGEIMKRYGFGRRDAVEPKEPLSEYVRKMEEENPEMVNIADWIAVDVKGAPLRSLTLGKLRDVESALRNIKKMARAGKNADGFVTLNSDGLVMTVNNLVDAAETNAKDRQVDMPDKVAPSKMAEFMAGLRKPSKWLLELDGFKDFGAWAKAFYHALADATDLKSFLVNRALQKLEAAYQRAGIDKAQRYRDAHTKIYVPEWETSMSKNWMMAVLLNMGCESNMQRLFSRHPVGISVNTAWNRETVTTVLARELGANYFRLAQDIWDAIDVYDEYAAMVKKVTGATLQKVNPSPISFTMPSGETIHLRGGYYHLKADPRSSKQAELNAEKELGDTPGIMPYPNTGASKARAASASYSVDLDLTNIHQSIKSQAHDIAFRPVAIDINKLMRSEAVKEVFRRKLGDAAYKTFSKWLRVIESGKNAVESQGYMDPAANFFRQRAVVANLLFRVGTVFQNFANPALYGNAVEGFSNKDALMAYMKYGWGEYIPLALSFSAEAEAIRQEVFALSAMMRDKAENPDYTMRDMFDRQDGFVMNSGSAAAREVGARLKIGRDGVVRFGSGMLAFGDQLADIPVWRYAYHKALNEGRSQQEAVRFADSVIENSTGTGRAVDSSMMQMGSPMEKLLTMFMTFANTQYNRWANEYGIYMKEKDHARLLSFIGVQYLMFGALSAVFSFKGKKDDEELLEWFTKEVLEWPLSMIPIGGSLFKLVIDRSLGFQSYSWAMSPVERNLEQTAKLAVGAWQGKATTEDAMQTAAFLFGYPDQFNDWFWNAYDASVGNMDPELRDLVRRRPKRERR